MCLDVALLGGWLVDALGWGAKPVVLDVRRGLVRTQVRRSMQIGGVGGLVVDGSLGCLDLRNYICENPRKEIDPGGWLVELP